jgi:hypothetical protein
VTSPATAPAAPGHDRRSAAWRSRDGWIAIAATAVLAVLALIRSGVKQIWVDESVAIGLTHVSLRRFLFVVTHWEVNQAPYYVLFAAWHVLGEDPATMRALAGLFAVATVPLLYLLGRRLYSPRVGALASVLFAVNAIVVQWSQQVRAYTMAVFLVTLATYLLVCLVDRPSTVTGLLYAAVAVLAVATHFFSALVIGAHLLSVLALRPRPAKVLAFTAATIGVLLVPFAAFVLTANGEPLAWVPDSTPTSTGRLLARLSGGSFTLVVATLVGGVGLLAAAAAWKRAPRSVEAWRAVLPVAWLVVPLVLTLGFSLIVEPIAVARFLIVVVPAISLLVALGVANLPWRWLRVVALVALLATSLYTVSAWYRAPSKEDWAGATAAVVRDLRPGDAVIVEPRTGNAAAQYYARHLDGAELPILTELDFDGPAVGDRLWEMRRGDDVSGWLADAGLEEWRDRHYVLTGTQEFEDVTVRLYVRRDKAS